MLSAHADPIVAVATAAGRGAVGIVRVSGKDLGHFVGALFSRQLEPRRATYLPFCDRQGQTIDHGLAIYFAAPHSFTGEDVLELQAHGGPVVLQMLVARCLELAAKTDSTTGRMHLAGLRLAGPGEFSQRAFLNNKIDLAQAEAIADLIDANTEVAARSAVRSLSGAFSFEISNLRDGLIHLRMLVEATLDFPEEEVDVLRKADARGQLANLQQALSKTMYQSRQGAILREGIKVVIAGQPNAGKSSLLNALAGAELAIVTPIAGTTRDKIEQTIQIEGVSVHVIDTAGLRDAQDDIERIGIARAWDEISRADAVLLLHDLTRHGTLAYDSQDARIADMLKQRLRPGVAVIELWNKADVAMPEQVPAGIALSAKTGLGLAVLRQRLLAAVGWQGAPEGLFLARERHLQALGAVASHLVTAADILAANCLHLELLAEELRLAQMALNQITGEFSSDDLLGEIFSRFCIGK